jgi:hypothetical protein
MPDLPAGQLKELINSIDKGLYNKKDSVQLDTPDYKLLDWWKSRRKNVEISQGVIRVNALTVPDLDSIDFQVWTGLDNLGGKEQESTLGLEFGKYNIHSGSIFRHEMLMDAGFNVDFNMSRKNPSSDFTPLSTSEAHKLRDLIKEKLLTARIGRDIKMNYALLLDGATGDFGGIPGLDQMVSLSPAAGTYGGQPLTNPALQNYAATGLTYGAAGTIATAWDAANWAVGKTNGAAGMKITKYICGRQFADAVKAYAKANGWNVNTNAEGTGKLDITISDNGLSVNGIKLEIMHEFDDLDALYAPATPWSKRCYGLSEKSFVLGTPFQSDWKLSAPPDSGTVRMSMYSYDWVVCPFCIKKNANFVLAIA